MTAAVEKGAVPTAWLTCWHQWIGYAAAAWSLIFAALGLWWALDGAGFPFGRNDPRAEQ
jgi:hypothetical protein